MPLGWRRERVKRESECQESKKKVVRRMICSLTFQEKKTRLSLFLQSNLQKNTMSRLAMSFFFCCATLVALVSAQVSEREREK